MRKRGRKEERGWRGEKKPKLREEKDLPTIVTDVIFMASSNNLRERKK